MWRNSPAHCKLVVGGWGGVQMFYVQNKTGDKQSLEDI